MVTRDRQPENHFLTFLKITYPFLANSHLNPYTAPHHYITQRFIFSHIINK